MKRLFPLFIAVFAAGSLAAQESSPPKTPSREQTLYQYLLSEIAQQRGQPGLAWQGVMDLARKGHDARLARRATEIAFQSRQFDRAAESCLLWSELEPGSPAVRQVLGLLAGNDGHMTTVKTNLARWLTGEYAGAAFVQIPGILAKYPEKAEALEAVRELAKPYPDMAEAHWAISQTALLAGDKEAATAEVDTALKNKPGWGLAAVLKSQILRQGSDDAAEKYLKGFLAEYPAAVDARVSYARLLVGSRSYLSAREQFRLAAKGSPDDPELPYAVALLSQQIGDFADAEAQFRRVLDLDPRDANPVYFNLGNVAESRKDDEGAMGWFRKVGEGEYFVPAQMRIATMLARRDGLPAARKFLRESRQVENDSTDTRNQLVLAEVQLLREAKDYAEAYKLLTLSLEQNPDAADLLYDRAMVAEKLDKLDVLEADLRRVIALQPDRSPAYNALGYTLAERNTRLDEAGELIHKAMTLSPEDSFIQDSLGWLQYRQGKTSEALATLSKAYEARRDAEIAAHLGEVLWVTGKREEAQKLLQGALVEHPGNDALIAAIEKFKP